MICKEFLPNSKEVALTWSFKDKEEFIYKINEMYCRYGAFRGIFYIDYLWIYDDIQNFIKKCGCDDERTYTNIQTNNFLEKFHLKISTFQRVANSWVFYDSSQKGGEFNGYFRLGNDFDEILENFKKCPYFDFTLKFEE